MKPVPHGEPYAGKLHVRFDEGAGVPDNKGRPALLYTPLYSRTAGGMSGGFRVCMRDEFLCDIASASMSYTRRRRICHNLWQNWSGSRGDTTDSS